MAKIGIYLSEAEMAFVKDQSPGYLRGLVREAMGGKPLTVRDIEKGVTIADQPRPPAYAEMVRQASAAAPTAIPAEACPECGTRYKNVRLLGAVCYNEDCPRYKEKP